MGSTNKYVLLQEEKVQKRIFAHYDAFVGIGMAKKLKNVSMRYVNVLIDSARDM